MTPRRTCRETVLKALFQCDTLGVFNSHGIIEFFSHFTSVNDIEDEEPVAVPDSEFARSLALGVVTEQAAVDGAIALAATNWSVARMSIVDRNILRLGAYELLFREDTPSKVVINEAIEIAKSFAADESPKFINGVLDRVAISRRGQ